ncbi:MAG TPA: DUF1269 domain-containing protein [Thermomicrobiales bacterium]
MAILIALVYPDPATAQEAERTARGLQEAGFLNILDLSVITKNDKGKIEHHGERHPVGAGAATGAVLGGITGLFFFVPVAGAAAGAALGGIVGRWMKSGASRDFEKFREQVSNDLQPGGAALVLLGQTEGRDRIIHDLGQHGGILRSTDVSDKELAAIQAEIDKVSGASAGSPS